MNVTDSIHIASTPSISGLAFRHFRGPEDYPKMLAVIVASADADKIERVDTVEDIANGYSHLVNCDPYQDMIFAEINNEVIGYSRGFWRQEENGSRIYMSVGFLDPVWRRKGIGEAMLHWIENRLQTHAVSHSAIETGLLELFIDESNVGLAAMAEKNNYKPVRYFVQMVRPDLEDIPDYPIPEGLEVRPVLPEHYRGIWEADQEAFRDHWGYSKPTEEDYQGWLENRTIFQPELWQIAWDIKTNEIAGQVRTFILWKAEAEIDRYEALWTWRAEWYAPESENDDLLQLYKAIN